MKAILLSLIVILAIHCDSNALRMYKNGRRKFGNVGSPRILANVEIPPDEWIEQKLDHFNPMDTRIWQQRYYTNDSFYEPGGPIFLMIGGEGEASPYWMISGSWIDYAMELNALCFQVEHRYYGKSRPTEDLSVENLEYLSSEQALADLAEFIVTMNKKYEFPEGTKWVSFGGSYSGSLSAWLRAKYSHLVHAAVSTSGPILAKLNFKEYMGVVRNSLATEGGQECVDVIQDAFAKIDLNSEELNVTGMFQLCHDEIDDLSENDISNFYEALADEMAGIVQYDGWFTENETSIEYICSVLTNDSIGEPIERYAAVNTLMVGEEGCLDVKYESMIAEYRNTSWNSDAAEGGRQWLYQTCSEFGYYQTSDESPHIFGEHFGLEFFIEQCGDIFGEGFNYIRINDAVDRTNMMYGGLSIDVPRIVYIHGSIDPWHALGLIESDSEYAPAIYIEGTSHCADMYSYEPEDSQDLIDARNKILEYLKQWLQE